MGKFPPPVAALVLKTKGRLYFLEAYQGVDQAVALAVAVGARVQ